MEEFFFFFGRGSRSTLCRSNLRPPPVAKLEDQRRSLGRFSSFFSFFFSPRCSCTQSDKIKEGEERRVGGEEEEKQQQIR